jgi:hypothetical protein
MAACFRVLCRIRWQPWNPVLIGAAGCSRQAVPARVAVPRVIERRREVPSSVHQGGTEEGENLCLGSLSLRFHPG